MSCIYGNFCRVRLKKNRFFRKLILHIILKSIHTLIRKMLESNTVILYDYYTKHNSFFITIKM